MTNEPFVLPLSACHDRALTGGKAVGLGKLIELGFQVPPGVCLTAAAYRHTLQNAGLDIRAEWERLRSIPATRRHSLLEKIRRRVTLLTLSEQIHKELEQHLGGLVDGTETLWAVRSSCSEEDGEEATFGGLFRTVLGVPTTELAGAIGQCWASLWTLPAWQYRKDTARGRPNAGPPQMAVVVQPLLPARAAGVMYSHHPVTGDGAQIVINAVSGLAEPLVNGQVRPDHYIVTVPSGPEGLDGMKVTEHLVAAKRESAEARRQNPTPPGEFLRPAISEEEVLGLARLAKQVEQGFGRGMDIEWVVDDQGLWLLQARPIPGPKQVRGIFTPDICLWSRANFRETLPDVPSPLAVAWLQEYMETNILAHYRKAGCRIPPGVSPVRIVHGRPYINVTLIQALVGQLGGDASEVPDLMGGALAPQPPTVGRMPWWRLLWAIFSLGRTVFRVPRQAPTWFAKLEQLGLVQPELEARLNERELLDHLYVMNESVRAGDLTFAAVAAVSQALRTLRIMLQRRVQDSWRPLLNAATQGFGTVISARQILLLYDLAELAGQDPMVREYVVSKAWLPHLDRSKLAGTPFLAAFDRFLAEYGHRAIGESDVRSPRFAEEPGYVLGIIRSHLLNPAPRSPKEIQEEQVRARADALRQIRAAFGWRLHKWWWFCAWHRYLCRSQALREANRHYLMVYMAGGKRLIRKIADKLVARGVLETVDDLFFLLPDEIRTIVAESGASRRDWKRIISRRRIQMKQDEALMPPDVFIGGVGLRAHAEESHEEGPRHNLQGMAISAGYAEGPIRLIRTMQDYSRVERGDILVMPVLDPGMAPLMGLAAGLVVEMGGMLSHGAIIAREYGIPALANVRQATVLLQDGERVVLDAARGELRRVGLRDEDSTAVAAGR